MTASIHSAPLVFSAEFTPLGWIGAVATGQGLCWVAFGADPLSLRAHARRTFQPTALIDDANPFVSAYAIQNAGSAFRYPCERFLRDSLGGAAPYSLWTDAQLYGDCRSDRRAAGRARGRERLRENPLALITPCHRVIQKNGRLGGYRWGVARKAALLALENRGNTHARAQNLFTILLRTRDTGSGGARNPHIYQICSASCAPSFPV